MATNPFILAIDDPTYRTLYSSYPIGIYPNIKQAGEDRFRLIVKATKEMILAAKERGEILMYIVPTTVNGLTSISLITAFPDSYDEPLIIFTPLFDQDTLFHDLKAVLQAREFLIHFVDEHGREWLGCRVSLKRKHVIRFSIDLHQRKLFPDTVDAKQAYINACDSFSYRDKDDDAKALRIPLDNQLYEGDFSYFSTSIEKDTHDIPLLPVELERPEPGSLSEYDISLCLCRSFPEGAISNSPRRDDTREEFCDILVTTSEHILIVQAKDSPNTKGSVERTISRKAATTRKHVEKAISQITGSISYLQRKGLAISGPCRSDHSIDGTVMTIYGLIVVTEKFQDDQKFYVDHCTKILRQKGVAVIIISYAELHDWTFKLRDPDSFISAFIKVFYNSQVHGQFARLNII